MEVCKKINLLSFALDSGRRALWIEIRTVIWKDEVFYSAKACFIGQQLIVQTLICILS